MDGTPKRSKSKISKYTAESLERIAAAKDDFALNLEDMQPAVFLQHILEPLSKNQFCVNLNLDGVKSYVESAVMSRRAIYEATTLARNPRRGKRACAFLGSFFTSSITLMPLCLRFNLE